jgi:hypothetical protein
VTEGKKGRGKKITDMGIGLHIAYTGRENRVVKKKHREKRQRNQGEKRKMPEVERRQVINGEKV